MKQLLIVLSVLLIIGTSCSHDDDNKLEKEIENGISNEGPTDEYAPSSMVGKIIRWDEHNSDGTAGNSNVRVKFNNSTDMSTNFSDWCTYAYKKKNDKTAHLNFMAPQRVAGVVRTFQYDFDLIFTTSSEFNVSGTLIVNTLSGPNVGSTVYKNFSGKGRFVDDLYGSDPVTPGSEADIAKYVGTWNEDVDKSEPGWSLQQTWFTFKSDGSYSYGRAWLTGEVGTFKCTSSSINLYKNEKFVKTLYLNGKTLKDNSSNKTYTKQ